MPAIAASNPTRSAHDRLFAGKYAVERVIGRGGMGTVFEARHTRLGQRVAIKVLGAALRDHPDLVKRFEREARAAGSLSSPHAARVLDIDTADDGTPFMVMELLGGRDLAKIVAKNGPQPIGLAVRWVIEASDAIAEAHRLGIIHRDIKPSNLFLCDEGTIKVLDFGIAKRVAANEEALTVGVAPLGTPQYMSPEQVRCVKDLDARTDVWSLGVTLYELVTGRPPYDHDIPQACIAAIVIDPVPDPRGLRPDLPDDLADVILRALEKDRDERFQSVEALVAALERFSDTARHADAGSPRAASGARPSSGASDSGADDDRGTEDGLTSRPSVRTTRDARAALEAWSRDARARPMLGRKLPSSVTDLRSPSPATRDGAGRERASTRGGGRPSSAKASFSARARRVRSAIAAASAAALGLVALIVTPRRVGGEEDAPTVAAAAVSTPRAQAAAPALTSALEGAGDEAADMAEEEPEAVGPASIASRKVSRPSAARPQPTAAKPVSRPASDGADGPGRARVIGKARLVHGGLSSPGF